MHAVLLCAASVHGSANNISTSRFFAKVKGDGQQCGRSYDCNAAFKHCEKSVVHTVTGFLACWFLRFLTENFLLQATVLIETLPGAFEMDEILFELREHSAGLNCGRWDYIFSFIKTLREDPKAVMPDRYCLASRACKLSSNSTTMVLAACWTYRLWPIACTSSIHITCADSVYASAVCIC